MTTPTAKAIDVARYFLKLAARDGKRMTNEQLHCLLYYAQAWYLVEHGRPLFREKILAWPK